MVAIGAADNGELGVRRAIRALSERCRLDERQSTGWIAFLRLWPPRRSASDLLNSFPYPPQGYLCSLRNLRLVSFWPALSQVARPTARVAMTSSEMTTAK